MPSPPFPITAKDAKDLIEQVQLLVFELYEERLGGALVGDVFTIGADDVFTLTLSSTGGLEKSSSALQIKIDSDGGLETGADGAAIKIKADNGLIVDSDGIYVKIKADNGIIVDSDGIYVKVRSGYGINVDSNGLALKQQAAETDASAVSSISCGAGSDQIDLSTFNTDLGTLVTEVNALKTTLNNLLAKLRSAEVIAT